MSDSTLSRPVPRLVNLGLPVSPAVPVPPREAPESRNTLVMKFSVPVNVLIIELSDDRGYIAKFENFPNVYPAYGRTDGEAFENLMKSYGIMSKGSTYRPE